MEVARTGLSDRLSELDGVLAAWAVWAVCPTSKVSGTKVAAVAAAAIRRRLRLRVSLSREKFMDRPRWATEGASTTLSLVAGVVARGLSGSHRSHPLSTSSAP
jgi:hypothetical protein